MRLIFARVRGGARADQRSAPRRRLVNAPTPLNACVGINVRGRVNYRIKHVGNDKSSAWEREELLFRLAANWTVWQGACMWTGYVPRYILYEER
jgi:hypothetical protein